MSDVGALRGYTNLEPIGHGGVGDVFRAVRVATGGTVAIKQLRDVTDESAAWRRCRRELSALLALGSHPHVIDIVEVLAIEGRPALVMEYAPGGSVADLAVRHGAPLTPADTARLGSEAAAALAAAHARGIVHRDVKPHNLLLDADGHVKLCDFGIAAIVRSPEFRHATANVSLRFASPEDLEGDTEVGPPADVYSLGATLLYLVRGEHLAVRDRLVPWVGPGAESPDLAAIDGVIAACLQPRPADRPSPVDVAARLAALAAGDPDREHLAGELVERDALDGDGAGPREPVRDPAAGGEPLGVLSAHTLPRPFPGYEPPVLPRPSPVSPRSRRRRALVAVLLAAAALAGSAATMSSRRGGGDRETRLRMTDRPAGLVELAALEWPAGAVGECLVQRPGRPVLGTVECAAPHDLQRLAAGTLPTPPDAAFVAADVDAAVDALCAAHAARLAGAAPAGHSLAVAVTRPSPEGWEAGDRAYVCYVGVRDRRVSGSAAASALPSR